MIKFRKLNYGELLSEVFTSLLIIASITLPVFLVGTALIYSFVTGTYWWILATILSVIWYLHIDFEATLKLKEKDDDM